MLGSVGRFGAGRCPPPGLPEIEEFLGLLVQEAGQFWAIGHCESARLLSLGNGVPFPTILILPPFLALLCPLLSQDVSLLLILCVCVFPTFMFVSCVCLVSLESVKSPRTVVTDSCELPWRCWDLNPHPLK